MTPFHTLRAMKVLTSAALGITLLAATSAYAQTQEWAKGRVIVMQRAGLPASELATVLKPHGGKARRMGRSDLFIVDLPANMPETTVVRLLAKHPALKFAQLDYKVPKALASNDPYGGSQWHLPKTRTPSAWDNSQGSGMTIAVLDGGVTATHEDLVANLLPGYNAWDGGTTTTDINNHGTAVAGAAAAALNNSVGVSGVAGAAKIKPIRITDYAGTAWSSTIANGVIYAADQGIRVVNCSYVWLYKTAAVQSAGNYLKSKGGLLVVAAGNNGVNESAPFTSSMISVSATDSNDQLAGWSSYGDMVSIAAPGVGIWTTSQSGGYESASGTSFAAPVVSGVIALMMAANPSLGAGQIESLLYSTATDLGPAGRDIYFGYGRVNAEAAVLAAQNAVSTADTLKPSVSIAAPTAGVVSGLVAVDVAAADNVGVTKVELRVNGALVAFDSSAPFQFSWDSKTVANGSVTMTALAFDAAGNSQTSAAVALSVSNTLALDTTPPTLILSNPKDGTTVSGTVAIGSTATDNAGAAGIRQMLYINGALRQATNGGALSFNWNTRKEKAGSQTITVVATDAAGNGTTRTLTVLRR